MEMPSIPSGPGVKEYKENEGEKGLGGGKPKRARRRGGRT